MGWGEITSLFLNIFGGPRANAHINKNITISAGFDKQKGGSIDTGGKNELDSDAIRRSK